MPPLKEGSAMLPRAKVFALLCLSALLSGLLAACYPTSENPIGVSAGPTALDARLTGVWKGRIGTDKDATAYLFAFPREGGRLEAMLLHPSATDDKGDWTTVSLTPGKAGTANILNAKLVLDNGAPAREGTVDYTPVLYRFDPSGELRLFVLDEKALADAVRQNRIAGTVKESSLGNDVRLTADAKTLDAFFAANAAALFTEDYGSFRQSP
jgi:hypothetical protein